MAEVYVNASPRTISLAGRGWPCVRYWVHGHVLVGGSVNDAADGARLREEFGVAGVLNLEAEQSDVGKGFSGDELLELPVVDNSREYDPEHVRRAVAWARTALERGAVYVHCYAGGGRSAAFAYGILRACLGYSAADALSAIRRAKDWKLVVDGRVCLGSITEWPALEWGDPALGSAQNRASVESALAGRI
jgi:hypothetical protein